MISQWPYPKLFAHRGAGTLAPENTLAAMRVGHEMGYRAVEFDVMLTQDNVPCVIHDPQLGRTVAAAGAVSKIQYQQLAQYDAGSWHSAQFAGEAVPTLDAVVQFCCKNKIAMNIEIKPAPGFERETGVAVAQALARYHQEFSILQQTPFTPLVSSFNLDALRAFRQWAPKQPAGVLFSRAPDDWFAAVNELQCQAIHCQYRLLTQSLVKQIKQRGFWLFCYTINDVQAAQRLLDWGIDGFCTDRLDLFTAMLPAQ